MADDAIETGCGCLGCIVQLFVCLVPLTGFVLVITALFFGLPVGDKKWNIDIFPPRVWDMNAEDGG